MPTSQATTNSVTDAANKIAIQAHCAALVATLNELAKTPQEERESKEVRPAAKKKPQTGIAA